METQVVDKKPVPAGLKALVNACRRFYYDQPQPFYFIPNLEKWKKRICPLDFISVYRHFGYPAEDIAPHWHYIGFGLSDLSNPYDNGFGIELTFRLKREPDECKPPAWPTAIMQGIASYVFENRYIFFHGDSFYYGFPFDETEYPESGIRDLLFFEDPQLGTVTTQFGRVTFLQLVGVYEKELDAAWPGRGERLIEVMQSVKGAGGPWLITDMRRDKTIFELDSSAQEVLDTCYSLGDYFFRLIRWSLSLRDQYKSSSKKNK